MSDTLNRNSTAADAEPASNLTEDLTRHYLATLAQWTGGLSPHAFGGAWLDWLSHLSTSPGKQGELL